MIVGLVSGGGAALPGVSCAAAPSDEKEEMMKAKQAAKLRWNEADRARHRAIREEVEHCPTQEELEASGAYHGPIKSGAYFQVRVLLHELKKARQTAGLTLDLVS